MLSTISTLAHTIWAWLPETTVGLQFATALIGFCLTAEILVWRLHRRMRPRPLSRDDRGGRRRRPGARRGVDVTEVRT
ncbi:MAG: hypothetical protein ACRDTE_06650 [Pseudonocardiaceae bacterium]